MPDRELPVWTMPGWHVIQAIADGYLVSYNAEDNSIYVFGKGPSATTVTASPEVTTKGNAVLIKGTVTDRSSGQIGSPCIADEDMANWMNYLKRQQPKPENARGVPVTLSAVDANDNTITIGEVESDMSGVYSFLWTPPDQGVYKIQAKFSGSDSYGSSHAETAIGVSAAASSVSSTPIDLYIIAATIVILIAIAIAIILLRKDKKAAQYNPFFFFLKKTYSTLVLRYSIQKTLKVLQKQRFP